MSLINNKHIANESIELGKKSLHAEAEQKLLGIILDRDLLSKPYKVDYKNNQLKVKCLDQCPTVND